MALEVPANVHQAMKEAGKAWEKLGLLAAANRGAWSKQQQEQLELVAEIVKQLHAALNRLINANS